MVVFMFIKVIGMHIVHLYYPNWLWLAWIVSKAKRKPKNHVAILYISNLLFIRRNLLSVLVTRYTFPCCFYSKCQAKCPNIKWHNGQAYSMYWIEATEKLFYLSNAHIFHTVNAHFSNTVFHLVASKYSMLRNSCVKRVDI